MSTDQYSRSTLELGGAPLWPDARDHADRKIDCTQDFKRLRNWLEKGVARAWPAQLKRGLEERVFAVLFRKVNICICWHGSNVRMVPKNYELSLLWLRSTVQRLYAVETKVYSSKIMLETEDHCFSAEAFQNCGTGNLKFCAPTGCHERTSFGGSEESLWVSKVGRKFWKKKKFVSFQNFKKIDLMISINRLNRLNRKNSQNRLNRFIGQRINTQQRLRYVPWAL